MNHKINICFLFGLLCFLLVFCAPSSSAITQSGSTIEGYTEVFYEGGAATSEITSTEVIQIYGVTMTPTDSAASVETNATYYFPHYIENRGNGTDKFTFTLDNITPEGWSAELIVDDDMNSVHDGTETTTVPAYVYLAEEATYYFFLALTAGATEVEGAARVTVTTEVNDGPGFYGANGIFYGDNDLVSATDTATASAGAALSGLHIARDDSSGDITLTWEGGAADVYYLETTFEAAFYNTPEVSSASIEAINVTSPWTSEAISAQDGVTRYYRVTTTGSSDEGFAPEVVGKFDMDTFQLFNLISGPLDIVPPDENTLNDILGTQLTAGTNPGNGDRIYSYVSGGWQQSYLRVSTGWTGTLASFEVDNGYWIKVTEGNPQNILTLVGEVSSAASREVQLVQAYNMVGNGYPETVALNDTGLDAVLTAGTNPGNADKIYEYIATPTGSSWKQAYLRAGTGWLGTLTHLTPGKGYWIYKQASGTVTWYYPRPY